MIRKLFFHKLVGALAAVMLVFAFLTPLPVESGELPESDDPIRITVLDWSQQQVMSHIAGTMLEDLGYNVEYVSATFSPSVLGLAAGELTFTLEVFSTMGVEALYSSIENGKIEALGKLGIEFREGLMYPAFMEDQCPGLPDWTALLECKEVFATPETLPKGRILGFPQSWEITYDKSQAMAYLGEDNYHYMRSGSEGNMAAEIKSAFLRKQPILVFFWAPMWIHSDELIESNGGLKWVETDPPYEEGCGEDPALGKWPDRVWDCTMLVADVSNYAWEGMRDKWPTAYRLMKQFTMDNNDELFFARRTDGDGEPVDAVADEWLAANESKWRGWLDAAMAGS